MLLASAQHTAHVANNPLHASMMVLTTPDIYRLLNVVYATSNLRLRLRLRLRLYWAWTWGYGDMNLHLSR